MSVDPGQSIAVDLVLTSDAAQGEDFNTSALFTVLLSKPGLTYTSYAWASPYTTGGGDDNSKPDALPATLAADSYVAGFGDAGAVDAYFENFLDAGQFTTGTLLTMNLTVPAGFEQGAFTITAVPDTFDDGTDSVPATGQSMTVNVVPEPAVAGLVAPLALGLLARRGRRSVRAAR